MTTEIKKLDVTSNIPLDRGRHPRLINNIPIFNDEHASSAASKLTTAKNLSIPLSKIGFESLKTFVQVLFKKAPTKVEPPLLTSGATSTEDEFSNISYFIRTFMPESPSTQAMGVTTGENIFQGFWAMVNAHGRFMEAKKIQDRGGMIEGGMDGCRGLGQSIGGAAYLGYRGTMIASDIQGLDTSVQATTSLGQASFILGLIGNICFLIFYITIGAWSSYRLTEDFKFSIGMKAHENSPEELFDFLMRKVTADPKVKLKKMSAYFEKLPLEKRKEKIDHFKEKLSEVALFQLTDHFLIWQEELVKTKNLIERPLTRPQIKEIFKVLFEMKEAEFRKKKNHATYAATLGLEEKDLQNFDFSTIELIGFKLEEGRNQAKKQAKFSRATNTDCTEAVTKQVRRGLSERLKCKGDKLVRGSAVKELHELQGKVVAENTKNKTIHTALIVVAVLGIILSVLSFVTLNPAVGIALMVVTLLLVGTMTLTDGSSMYDGWKSDKMPGRYDKVYLIVISLVIVAAFAISVGVTLGLSLSILPLILSSVITSLTLGLGGFSYYNLTQKEKDWIENHPDLQRFKELLDSVTAPRIDVDVDDKVTALFKKLSKADRMAIRKEYFEMNFEDECEFQQLKYKKLNVRFDFGHEYILQEITCHGLQDEKEYQLMIRAMKKSVKFFWEEWANSKSAINRERALKLQSLFESMKQKQVGDIREKMNKIANDSEIYDRLNADLWYVVKRQESVADLKQVVEVVSQNGTISASVLTKKEKTRNEVAPLIESVCQAFIVHNT